MCTATFDKIKRMSEASASGGNLLRSTQKMGGKSVDKRFIRFLDRREKEMGAERKA